MSVPIVLAWLALLFVLNMMVPQLEEVGKDHQVSLMPKDAPSVQAMTRIGKDFSGSRTRTVRR